MTSANIETNHVQMSTTATKSDSEVIGICICIFIFEATIIFGILRKFDHPTDGGGIQLHEIVISDLNDLFAKKESIISVKIHENEGNQAQGGYGRGLNNL